MSEIIWSKLKYFSENENWGSPKKMNGTLLLVLDEVRGCFPKQNYFIVHNGYATKGHSPYSQHYLGGAVDFHITNMNFKQAATRLLDIFDNLQLSNFIGFGAYPTWNNPGFHLDVRGKKARWGSINNTYCSIEEAINYRKD